MIIGSILEKTYLKGDSYEKVKKDKHMLRWIGDYDELSDTIKSMDGIYS